VLDADGGRGPALPAVDGVAERGERDRLWRGGGCRLLAVLRDQAEDVVLDGQDGVASGDLPLAVRAISRESVAELDGAEHAALRAPEPGGVALHAPAESAPAELRPRDLGVLPGEVQEEIEPVRPQIAQASAARDGGIEHPRRTPRGITRGRRAVQA